MEYPDVSVSVGLYVHGGVGVGDDGSWSCEGFCDFGGVFFDEVFEPSPFFAGVCASDGDEFHGFFFESDDAVVAGEDAVA